MDEVTWTRIPITKTKTPETPETPEARKGDPLSITDQGGVPQTAPETPETPDNFEKTGTSEQVFLKHLERWRDVFRFPDIVTESRPSLRSVTAYAFRGDWGPDEGLARALGKLYAVIIAVPLVGALYTLAVVVERPTRLGIAAGLVALIAWYFGWLWWS